MTHTPVSASADESGAESGGASPAAESEDASGVGAVDSSPVSDGLDVVLPHPLGKKTTGLKASASDTTVMLATPFLDLT